MKWIFIKIALLLLNRMFSKLKKRNSRLDYFIKSDYREREITIWVNHPDDDIRDKVDEMVPDEILGMDVIVKRNQVRKIS